METKDFFNEEVGSLRHANGLGTGKELGHLGKAIFDDNNGI
jgi:hypothetical protein